MCWKPNGEKVKRQTFTFNSIITTANQLNYPVDGVRCYYYSLLILLRLLPNVQRNGKKLQPTNKCLRFCGKYKVEGDMDARYGRCLDTMAAPGTTAAVGWRARWKPEKKVQSFFFRAIANATVSVTTERLRLSQAPGYRCRLESRTKKSNNAEMILRARQEKIRKKENRKTECHTRSHPAARPSA